MACITSGGAPWALCCRPTVYWFCGRLSRGCWWVNRRSQTILLVCMVAIKDMDEAFEWAAQIDNIVLLYLKDVALQKKYIPQVFWLCRGVLRKRPSVWTSYFKNWKRRQSVNNNARCYFFLLNGRKKVDFPWFTADYLIQNRWRLRNERTSLICVTLHKIKERLKNTKVIKLFKQI